MKKEIVARRVVGSRLSAMPILAKQEMCSADNTAQAKQKALNVAVTTTGGERIDSGQTAQWGARND